MAVETADVSVAPRSTERRRRLAGVIVAPLLLLITLLSWAFASPVGSSPDDDFHLASVWCAAGDSPSCEQVSADVDNVAVRVPTGVVSSSCYAFDPLKSAACQSEVNFDSDALTETSRYNAYGAYPPVFYSVMHVFVGDNIVASVMAMRILTAVLFTLLATALFLVLPALYRPTLVWGWLVTTVPLGMFIITSNNPSSWAIIGVGMAFLALVAFFKTSGIRRISAGVLTGIFAVMAAGSRGDAAMYLILVVACAVILTFERTRRYLWGLILPAAVVLFCVAAFRFSRPIDTVTAGIDPVEGGRSFASTFWFNVREVPKLWGGVFGREWGLGWLDTAMPSLVWVSALAAFLAVGFLALRGMTRRKLVVVVGGVLVLVLFPVLFLSSAGSIVGENMQPRYLLPLVVLFAMVLLYPDSGRPVSLTRFQSVLVWLALSGANALALNFTMQRFVHGYDDLGFNLDKGIEWWWADMLSPLTVWIIGSLAFAVLSGLLIRGARRVAITGGVRRADAALS